VLKEISVDKALFPLQAMVFSFFKKETKMVARPAAVPRARPAYKDSQSPGDDRPQASGNKPPDAAAPVPEPLRSGLSGFDSSNFALSAGALDYQVETDIDPVDAEAEKAAIFFANEQDEAACGVLESAVRIHHVGPGERLWLMLFDLYQLTEKRVPFEALGIDYARSFEKSPPGWRAESTGRTKHKAAPAGNLLFHGDLAGDNNAGFELVRQSLEKNQTVRLDLSSLRRLDASGCGRLLALLQQSRKAKRELELLGRDTLRALLEDRIEPGCAEDHECWLLLLEIYQLQGQHDAFDEGAINYAVTFEVSPPSWEARRVAGPEPALQLVDDNDDDDHGMADAYVLRGDIKALRFGDLPARTEKFDPVIIDCLALTRIDFISAGALLNVLTMVRRTGKQVVFHHPNHLVAELLGVVGLNAVASIIFAKR